jgi:hypothetical protein
MPVSGGRKALRPLGSEEGTLARMDTASKLSESGNRVGCRAQFLSLLITVLQWLIASGLLTKNTPFTGDILVFTNMHGVVLGKYQSFTTARFLFGGRSACKDCIDWSVSQMCRSCCRIRQALSGKSQNESRNCQLNIVFCLYWCRDCYFSEFEPTENQVWNYSSRQYF